MNSIGKITFNFNMQNETFARKLYARWDSFFALNFERIADETLCKLGMKNEELVIDMLELDLGSMQEENFDEQFPLRVREKLEEAIIQWKIESGKLKMKENPHSSFLITNSSLKWLCHFLLHGTLPWNTPAEYKNIPYLFTVVLQQEGSQLKQFLQTYGHYTSLQERLVYQLNDPELEKGVQLLQPSNAAFICSYVSLLHAKYATIERPGLEEPAYRNTVWLVVYAYLLNNRSSYFDKKTFLAQTILRLATKHNVSYEHLLEMITRELEHFSERLTIPAELFKLLGELRKELSEQQFQRSAFSAATFYQTIAGLLQKEIRQGVNESTRESLLLILSRGSSCRAFLQQLTEPEIIGLVPIVVPNKSDSDFVIQTARELVIRNEQLGMSNEKNITNSSLLLTHLKKHSSLLIPNYSLIKWQFIFPLLLSNRGATLNRKYFVENLLKQIAAHYNLEYSDLLAYVYQNRNLFDNPLQIILQELSELGTRNEKRIISNEQLVMRNEKNIPHSSLLPTNSEEDSSLLPTNYYHELVRKYFPEESEFIIAYAKIISNEEIVMSNKKNIPKSSFLLTNLKNNSSFLPTNYSLTNWKFIFSVLSQLSGSTFNRRYLVEQTLQKIAAHYNLSYFDLLAYFQTTEAAIHLPFELQTLLNELFYDEKEHWVNIVLHSNKETDKFKLVKTLFPAEQAFIKTYVQALDHHYEKGLLQGKTSGNFRQIKWKFVFEVLFELQKVAFNKKQFIEHTLGKFAAHYNLTVLDLLSWLCADIGFASTFQDKEIMEILMAILNNTPNPLKGAKTCKGRSVKISTALKSPLNKKDLLFPLSGGTQGGMDLGVKEQIFNELYNVQITTKSTAGKTNTAIIKKYLLQYPASESERLLFEKLSQQTAFITYILEILSLLPELRKFLKTNFQLSVNNEKILQFLLEISSNYHSLSQAEILKRLLEIILIRNEKLGMMNELQIQNITNYSFLTTHSKEWGKIFAKNKELSSLIQENKKSIINKEESAMKNEDRKIDPISNEKLGMSNEQLEMSNEELAMMNGALNMQNIPHSSLLVPNSKDNSSLLTTNSEEDSSLLTTNFSFINNAGIVLLAPYLPRLFEMLKLTENRQFKDLDAQIRAIFLLQYAAFDKTEFPEHELTLNKLLIGFEIGQPLPKNMELTQHEKETVESLLKGVLQNWPKLSRTSIAALQQAFLQRNGKLEEQEDFYLLTVEDKPYDLLLDTCPWNFRNIKFPWMKKMIQVKWR